MLFNTGSFDFAVCNPPYYPENSGKLSSDTEKALARGESNFYDGWMQNPRSAMISCNDGFRPFSFYLEVVEDK